MIREILGPCGGGHTPPTGELALEHTPDGLRVVQKAFEVAFRIEKALCAELDTSECAELLSRLGRLRHHDPTRPGVPSRPAWPTPPLNEQGRC